MLYCVLSQLCRTNKQTVCMLISKSKQQQHLVFSTHSICAGATTPDAKAQLASLGIIDQAVALLAIPRVGPHSASKVASSAAQMLEHLVDRTTMGYFMADLTVAISANERRRVSVLDTAMHLLAENSERRQLSGARVLLCVLQHDAATASSLALCDPGMLSGLIRLLGSRYLHARAAAAALLHKAAVLEHNRSSIAKAGCIPALVDVLQASPLPSMASTGSSGSVSSGSFRQDAVEAECALQELAKSSLRMEIVTTCRAEQQARVEQSGRRSDDLDRLLGSLDLTA